MTEESAPYGTPLSFAGTDAEAAACLQRVLAACGCRTHAELAQILGVRQSSVSDAKRRGSIPSQWLLTLLCTKWINPAWILTDRGARYVRPAEYTTPNMPPLSPATDTGIPENLSTEALLAELVRRCSGNIDVTTRPCLSHLSA